MSNRIRPSVGAVLRLILAASTLALLVVAPAAGASRTRPDDWQRVRPGAHSQPQGSWVRIYPRVRQTKARTGREASVPAPKNLSRYGVAAGGNMQNLDPAALGRELDVSRTVGSRWIRIDINWEVIQAGGPTSYNWTPFDRVVQAANDRGLQVLAGIVYTPAWARPGTSSGTYPPSDLATFGAFCQAAVAHYAPMGVHHWEIWNEPNRGFWKPSPDPARYTQMLRLAYDVIKRADRQAFVVSGGLSPYGAYGQAGADGMNPLTFLEKMYDAGAADHFDALGWHPYEWGAGIQFHPWSAWSQLVETQVNARSIMTAHGDRRKQIWGTEYGAPTGRTMSESAQADLLRAAFGKWAGWDWAGPLFWYSARDTGNDPHDLDQNFGLVHHDFSPKPSFSAFQTQAR